MIQIIGWLVNYSLKGIWKEVVVFWFAIIIGHLHGETEENPEKLNQDCRCLVRYFYLGILITKQQLNSRIATSCVRMRKGGDKEGLEEEFKFSRKENKIRKQINFSHFFSVPVLIRSSVTRSWCFTDGFGLIDVNSYVVLLIVLMSLLFYLFILSGEYVCCLLVKKLA